MRYSPILLLNRMASVSESNIMRNTMNISKLPCCGYIIDECEVGPIFWNRFNNCVQCHNCGTVFDTTKETKELYKQPSKDASTPITEES